MQVLGEKKPIWIADMYAYSYAAARLNIWHGEVNQLWDRVFEQNTQFDEGTLQMCQSWHVIAV